MLRPSWYVFLYANARPYLTIQAAPGEKVPARVEHTSETRIITAASGARPLKRSYAMLGMSVELFVCSKLIVTVPIIRRHC